jgi:hypothetical protein
VPLRSADIVAACPRPIMMDGVCDAAPMGEGAGRREIGLGLPFRIRAASAERRAEAAIRPLSVKSIATWLLGTITFRAHLSGWSAWAEPVTSSGRSFARLA